LLKERAFSRCTLLVLRTVRLAWYRQPARLGCCAYPVRVLVCATHPRREVPMSDAHVRRFTALSGGAAFVLYLISALLILDAPPCDATSQALARYSTGHSTTLLLEVVVWGPATCATIAFAVGLWVLLRRTEGDPGLLAMLFLAAMIVTQTIVLGG